MAKALSQFAITQMGDEYMLSIEDEDGEVLELSASFDQLDLISEAIDEQLDRDEDDALGLDEDEDDEEEPEED